MDVILCNKYALHFGLNLVSLGIINIDQELDAGKSLLENITKEYLMGYLIVLPQSSACHAKEQLHCFLPIWLPYGPISCFVPNLAN